MATLNLASIEVLKKHAFCQCKIAVYWCNSYYRHCSILHILSWILTATLKCVCYSTHCTDGGSRRWSNTSSVSSVVRPELVPGVIWPPVLNTVSGPSRHARSVAMAVLGLGLPRSLLYKTRLHAGSHLPPQQKRTQEYADHKNPGC